MGQQGIELPLYVCINVIIWLSFIKGLSLIETSLFMGDRFSKTYQIYYWLDWQWNTSCKYMYIHIIIITIIHMYILLCTCTVTIHVQCTCTVLVHVMDNCNSSLCRRFGFLDSSFHKLSWLVLFKTMPGKQSFPLIL